MSKEAARVWLVKASLVTTAAVFALFIALPVFSSILSFGESLRLIEIVAPVFLGYLGMASLFLFRGQRTASAPAPPKGRTTGELFPLLVKGPVILFGLLVLATIAAFWFSNQPDANPGSGMTVDTLAAALSAELALLTVATNVIAANLFAAAEQEPSKRRP